MRFDGGVALVTGGGSGIGRETAVAFAEEGANVVVGDVDAEGGTETVAAIEDAGSDARFVEADVTDAAAVEAMVETAVETYGGIDVAFNNAGVEGAIEPTADYPEDEWRRVLDVNLTGVWRCMRSEIPRMVESGGGAIVNAGSVLSEVGIEHTSAYAAAKHGVLGVTRTAALEYAGDGVRVNAVCPAFVDTPMQDRIGLADDEEGRRYLEGLHAVGRLGRPGEVADAVLWLASTDASFVTGHALAVDGGYLSR